MQQSMEDRKMSATIIIQKATEITQLPLYLVVDLHCERGHVLFLLRHCPCLILVCKKSEGEEYLH